MGGWARLLWADGPRRNKNKNMGDAIPHRLACEPGAKFPMAALRLAIALIFILGHTTHASVKVLNASDTTATAAACALTDPSLVHLVLPSAPAIYGDVAEWSNGGTTLTANDTAALCSISHVLSGTQLEDLGRRGVASITASAAAGGGAAAVGEGGRLTGEDLQGAGVLFFERDVIGPFEIEYVLLRMAELGVDCIIGPRSLYFVGAESQRWRLSNAKARRAVLQGDFPIQVAEDTGAGGAVSEDYTRIVAAAQACLEASNGTAFLQLQVMRDTFPWKRITANPFVVYLIRFLLPALSLLSSWYALRVVHVDWKTGKKWTAHHLALTAG